MRTSSLASLVSGTLLISAKGSAETGAARAAMRWPALTVVVTNTVCVFLKVLMSFKVWVTSLRGCLPQLMMARDRGVKNQTGVKVASKEWSTMETHQHCDAYWQPKQLQSEKIKPSVTKSRALFLKQGGLKVTIGPLCSRFSLRRPSSPRLQVSQTQPK